MRRRVFLPACIVLFVVGGCSADEDAPGSPFFRDAGTLVRPDATAGFDAGVNLSDASANADAGGFRDSGVDLSRYGTRIANLPAEVVGIAGDEEVLFVRADGTLMAARPDGSGVVALDAKPQLIVRPKPHLWMWTELAADGSYGTLRTHRARETATALISEGTLSDFIALSDDQAWALILGELTASGNGTTSTLTADLILASADGAERRTILSDVHVSPWNRTQRAHLGPCSAEGLIPDNNTALVILCPNAATETRYLYSIDLSTGRTATVASDVLSFLRLSSDHSYALFLDSRYQMFAVSANGDRVVRVQEDSPIVSLVFLDRGRFAYVTSEQELLVAGWPDFQPEMLVPLGVTTLEAASPTGEHVMFHQTRAANGLRDLWLVRTSSPASPELLNPTPDGYPGDDAFSEDGQWVRWFSQADAASIGDVLTRNVDNPGIPILLAQRAWYVLNYGDPDRVILMVNARVSEENRRVIADVATRLGNGGGPLQVLVPNIDPSTFRLFPDRQRFVYRVPEGAATGLWVRAL